MGDNTTTAVAWRMIHFRVERRYFLQFF